MKKNVTRLFADLKPSNYQLTLELDPEAMRFNGQVRIRAKKTGRPSHRITLHQKDLKVTSAKLVRHGKKEDENLTVERINTHKAYDELRLHSAQMLYPGEYTIEVEFSGKITDQMHGLYPCYFKHDGADKKLLATQFESHHAREVFPCIDEPEAKATFDLTLCTPPGGEVLANTPVKKQSKPQQKAKDTDKPKTTRQSELVTTQFETTPIMSTYLLAFVYGEMGYKEAKTKRGTVVRTYATPDNVKLTDFALETSVRCLEYYEDYFDIPYPLEKCDMVALPDFAAGAMENWGLITYREQALLVDPKHTSLNAKQYVAMVIAHELAHQWFGNLVTMRWWTDLWLNEGFASWIEYLACHHLFPDWQMWTQFGVSEQQPAFKLDALDNTHPVEVPVHHPDEIRTIFDTISYSKGAGVIHMLHGYLGEKDFRDGLRHYLKQHAYGNTDTKDLWAALEQASGKPVKSFMHAWTSLPGFPLVTVSRNKGQIQLYQERFYLQKPARKTTHHWPIPLLAHQDAPGRLDTTSMAYDTAHFTKLNQGQSGFYRTLYSSDLLDALAEDLGSYEPLDRLGLLSDTFEAAKAGYTPVTDALKLLEAYHQEDSAPVWDIIAANLGEIRRVMDDEALRETIKPFIVRLTAEQLERLGYDEKKTDTYFDKLLRPTLLGLAASADEPDVLQWCHDSFKRAQKTQDIHADLRSVVFVTAARHGDAKTFDKLLKFHNDTALSEERVTLAAALTSFKQAELGEKALDLIPTATVRRQDATYWLIYSFMNHHTKDLTWQWLKNRWSWLEDALGGDLGFFRMPTYAARSFSSSDFLGQYDDFFGSKMSPGLERSIKQGREMLEWQIAWKERDLIKLLEYLARS